LRDVSNFQRDSDEGDSVIKEVVKKVDEKRQNLLILSVSAARQLHITMELSTKHACSVMPLLFRENVINKTL